MGTGVGNRGLCPLACRRPPRMITRVSIQAGSRCFVYLPNPTLLPRLYSARASLPYSRTTTRDTQKSPGDTLRCVPAPLTLSFPNSLLICSQLITWHFHTHSPRPALFLPMTCLSTFPDVQSNLADLAVPFSWAPPGNILKH